MTRPATGRARTGVPGPAEASDLPDPVTPATPPAPHRTTGRIATQPSPHPSRDEHGTTTTPAVGPLRDEHATTRCPVCRQRFTPVGRQLYCSSPCRKTAFRRRRQQPPSTVVAPARARRGYTVYECPDCEQLLAGEQRCSDCGTFARRVGPGGACPHCQEPVTLAELLGQEVTLTPRRT
jgi:hypothetical protein